MPEDVGVEEGCAEGESKVVGEERPEESDASEDCPRAREAESDCGGGSRVVRMFA